VPPAAQSWHTACHDCSARRTVVRPLPDTASLAGHDCAPSGTVVAHGVPRLFGSANSRASVTRHCFPRRTLRPSPDTTVRLGEQSCVRHRSLRPSPDTTVPQAAQSWHTAHDQRGGRFLSGQGEVRRGRAALSASAHQRAKSVGVAGGLCGSRRGCAFECRPQGLETPSAGPPPLPGRGGPIHALHGLRSARDDAGRTLPAAPFRRPAGARTLHARREGPSDRCSDSATACVGPSSGGWTSERPDHASTPSGISTHAVVPRCQTLSRPTVPPRALAACLTMASPSPVPRSAPPARASSTW